jgi:hypothetical protein
MAISNEKVLEFVRRNPIGVICGIISLGLGVGYYFRADLTPAADTELAAKETDSKRYDLNIKYAGGLGSAELKENYDSLATANKQIAARLVRTQFAVNYGYFEKICADSGAKKITLNQAAASTAAKAVPKGGFVPVAFTFVVQGTYGQILDVLYRLENGEHFCRILTASVTKGVAAGPGADLLTLNLSVELLGLQQ